MIWYFFYYVLSYLLVFKILNIKPSKKGKEKAKAKRKATTRQKSTTPLSSSKSTTPELDSNVQNQRKKKKSPGIYFKILK